MKHSKNNILFFFGFILAFVFMSCDNRAKEKKYLKEQVEITKCGLPISMGLMGEFVDIAYSEDTVTFHYFISSEFTPLLEALNDTAMMKDNFRFMASISNDLRKMMKDISAAGACLKISFKSSDTKYNSSTVIDKSDLQNIDNNLLSREEAGKRLLNNQIIQANKMYPQELGDGIKMTSISLDDNNIVYNVELNPKMYDSRSLKYADTKGMKKDMLEGLNLNDPTLRQFVELIVELGKGLCYRYNCNGVYVNAAFTNQELREQLRSN